MISNNTSRAAVSMDDSQRSTIRIRNVRESVVYHLMFDGDVGRLTGALLKQHVQQICGIPVEQQILTFNAFNVTNETTGYDLGLHDGCTLILDTMSRAGRRTLADGTAADTPSSSGALPQHHSVRGSSVEASHNPTSNVARPSVMPPSKSRFERELESLRRDDQSYRAPSSYLPRSTAIPAGMNNSAATSVLLPAAGAVGYPSSGLYDDVDVDVEITEESGAPLWQPTNTIDVEESRLLQQDYIWKMEQVRFETERMNREREMLRQKQELDYQAELLERERIEMERKTHAERLKLSMLQATLHDEMAIEAKISAMTEESVYRSRH